MKKLFNEYSDVPNGTFKRLYVTFLMGYIPFGFFQSILNIMHVLPVSFNDRNYYGMVGVLTIFIGMPFLVLFFTITVWLGLMMGAFVMRFLNGSL